MNAEDQLALRAIEKALDAVPLKSAWVVALKRLSYRLSRLDELEQQMDHGLLNYSSTD